MKKLLLFAFLSGFSMTAIATCDELKAKIEAKLHDKGVKYYTIEIRPVKSGKNVVTTTEIDDTNDKGGKIVGTCEGDSKEIIYKRL